MKMFDRKMTSFFNKRQININDVYLYKRKKWFWYSLAFLIVLLVVIAFVVLSDDISEFFINMPNLGKRIKELLSWDFKSWTKPTLSIYGEPFLNIAFKTIWDTFILSLSGTVIGVLLGIPFAILCANNIITNRFINLICKSILNVLRTIPSFVYALIFVCIFGKSALSITLAVAIFTFSMSSKMLFDKIEQINIYPYEALTSIGTSKFKAFKSSIVPQIRPHILSVLFYSLEVNLKYISIIALVSKRKGFGEMIDFYKQNQEWNKIGFLLFLLISTILMLELIIYLLQKYVFTVKDFYLNDKETKRVLKNSEKQLNKKNIDFYIDYVVLKKWNDDFNVLKNSYKNKEISKDFYKLEKSKLLKERKKLVNDFKIFHNQKIEDDKKKFKKIKEQYLNQPKNGFFENEQNIVVRYDRAYLTEFNYQVGLLKAELRKFNNEIIAENNKEFIKSLTFSKVEKAQRINVNYIKKFFVALFFLSLFIYSLTTIDVEMQDKESIQMLGRNLKSMFNIKWEIIFSTNENAPNSVIYLLFETFLITLLGTLIGFCFAFILAVLGSKNIVNKYVAMFFTIISTIIRPIPTYIYALLFVIIVGVGPVNGVLALAIGTTGMLSKYLRELYNGVDKKLLQTMEAIGLSNYQKFKYAILPYAKSETITWIIYRFEINFKEVVMLSIVGAGSMGFTLTSYFNNAYYREFGTLLFGIIIASPLIEKVSIDLKQKVRYDKNPKLINKIILKNQKRKICKYWLNAELLNIDYSNMSYEQLKALWINTNIDIVKNCKKYQNKKDAYYQAYCEKYHLDTTNCKSTALTFEKKFIFQYKKQKNFQNTIF